MKRLFFPAIALLATATGMLAFAACDPDLTPRAIPGDGGTDAPTPTPPGGDAHVTDPDGGADADATVSDDGSTEASAPVHVIDGTNDFAATEKFATTSPLYDGYVSWDDSTVYFGMDGKDVAVNTPTKWVLVYVDGNPGNAGTPLGIGYDCSGTCTKQQANLPFNAGFHIRWKADGSYTNLQKWDGTAWTDKGLIKDVVRSGPFMELAISRVALGSPTRLKVHLDMLIEQSGAEWTYSGVPSTSFTDGKAPPAFTKYFEFDLSDHAKAPNSYPQLP